MQNSNFKEITRAPIFILVLFFIQLIVFIIIYINNEESNFGIFYVLIPVTLLLGVSFLKISLNKNTFTYQLFPFHLKNNSLDWNQIEKIEIMKINALSDFLGWGLRYSRKYGTGYILGSDNALFITLKTGKKMTFTINDKSQFISFFKTNNIEYTE